MKREANLTTPAYAVENISTVNVIREKNYQHSYKNGRAKHALIYVASGALSENFTDEQIGKILISAGEVIFIPAQSKYVGRYIAESTEVKIVQFDIIGEDKPEYLCKPFKIQISDMASLIEAFFDGDENAKHPFYYLSCMYNLLWKLEEYYMRPKNKYKRLSRALFELTRQYYENFPVSYYAELCEMSEVNFRRLFREYTGTSPVEYRNGLRLEHARAKIQSGEYNVSEAAEASGFSNLSFFIRLYKKKYGYTPKKE